MYSEALLASGWTLEADELPERLSPEPRQNGFILPGASALADFADLLGTDAGESPADEPSPGVPFLLPAMFPKDVRGRVTLSREIDFGRLCGGHAALEIDPLCGSGHIELDGRTLLQFGLGAPCAAVDLTDALRLGRKQTLSFHFDDAQNAGLPGTVILRTTGAARFSSVRLTPSAAGRTFSAALTLHAKVPGTYAVRAAVVPNESENPWGESRINIRRAGKAQMDLSFPLRAPRFEAGKPYDAPVLKLELYALRDQGSGRTLCDVRTLTTGFLCTAPRCFIPLTKDECRQNPEELIAQAKAIGVPALFLPVPASALLYRRAVQEGVALLPYAPGHTMLPDYAADSPCTAAIGAPDPQAFAAFSPSAACYQLCASPAAPACEPGLPEDELLFDAAGRHIHPDAQETTDTLNALAALALRLRAEAARLGQYAGSLCGPGQWRDPALFEAIRCAFAPLHLCALPLRGAWWADSRFSATLHAFIPAVEQTGTYSAEAELADAQGCVLARTACDLPVRGGPAGVIEAQLPGVSCVLTLRTRLRRSGAIVESCELPVYVGLRGPLEAAFAE